MRIFEARGATEGSPYHAPRRSEPRRRRSDAVPPHMQEPVSGVAEDSRRRIDAQQGSAALAKAIQKLIRKGCR